MKITLLMERLLMALWQGPYCSARTLGEHLGVSTAQANLSLRKMRDCGWVVKGSRGHYGQTWHLTEVGFVAADAALTKHYGDQA